MPNLPEHLKRLRPSPLTLILIALIAYFWFRPPARISDQDRPVPNVQAVSLAGKPLDLADWRGKVVLVNFWATWCPYCRHEMPAMEKFYRDYRGKGFEMVAFSIDDDPAKVRQFMAAEGYRFPVAMSSPQISAAFGGVSLVPASFVIDKQGRIRKKVSGQVYYGRLEDLVAPLLKE